MTLEVFVSTYGVAALIIAFGAVLVTSALKPWYKKLLSRITDLKAQSDKLTNACFMTLLVADGAFSAVYLFAIENSGVSLQTYLAFVLAILSGGELLYKLYERLGLKSFVKTVLQKVSM